jgi:peptidoglycan hydrolase-like protein with peptidoglycan-binding domain
MRQIFTCAVATSLVWFSLAAAQTKKKAAAAPPSKTAKTGSTKKSTSKKTSAKRPPVTWRNRQSVPSAERYREIQSALATRGFLSPEEADGSWNQASADALKRFQQEQNLEPSGKVNSLSLIALGLGPKRDAAVVMPKPQDLPGQPAVDR